jgi:hypothetical protein
MRANEALAVFGPLGGRDDGLLAAASTLVFLPVESFWPSAGARGLPTAPNAPVSQILTLAPTVKDEPSMLLEGRRSLSQ